MPESPIFQEILQNGIFFVTICARKRECIFVDDEQNCLQMNNIGHFAYNCWQEIPVHFPHVQLDKFVVMPNHVHGIIKFHKRMATRRQHFGKPKQGSLFTIIKSYKSAVTRLANKLESTEGRKIWQNGFYEHRIKSFQEFQNTRIYIHTNPQRWMNT